MTLEACKGELVTGMSPRRAGWADPADDAADRVQEALRGRRVGHEVIEEAVQVAGGRRQFALGQCLSTPARSLRRPSGRSAARWSRPPQPAMTAGSPQCLGDGEDFTCGILAQGTWSGDGSSHALSLHRWVGARQGWRTLARASVRGTLLLDETAGCMDFYVPRIIHQIIQVRSKSRWHARRPYSDPCPYSRKSWQNGRPSSCESPCVI